MTVKAIAAYLMLLYFVTLCAFGSCYLKLTEKQFAAFKGLNPCETDQRKQDICDKLAKPPGSTAPLIDGPQCGLIYVSYITSSGVESAAHNTALMCKYKANDPHPKTFIMGQAENHVMRCEFDADNVCHPTEDVQFP